MKIKIFIIIIFYLLTNKSFANINLNIDCANLVNQLGGLNKINILWLQNLNQKKFQYALINIKQSNNKKFYLCGNKYNINSSSDETISVLSDRNLQFMTYDPIELFTEVFSLTSQDSRKYIMQRLDLKDFLINRNQLNQAYIAGLMKLNDRLEASNNKTEDKVVKKTTKKKPKKIKTTDNNEKQKIIDKIERLTPGDYYFFGHATSGEKYWGSTIAISKTVQVGKSNSSGGKKCHIRSEQKTKKAPFKGIFFIKCPNDRIDGSWTQVSASSAGLGEGFTDSGEVVTAYFSPRQYEIINFADKYFNRPSTEIAKLTKKKQKEIKLSESQDKTAPKIIIAKNLTFKNSSYKLEGRVEDKGSNNIYVEIDGVIQNAKDGKFIFERFSPVDETVKIVAIDQWGNRSKEKIVKIKIDTKSNVLVKKIEKLNPNKVKFNQLSKDKVAIVIGIEGYDRSPKATFANLDAKYFYEYARLSFGIPKENIKLLIDDDANLIQSLGVIEKWLPGKINKNRSELLIFFAGHGLASNDGKDLYLLSQDSDPDLLKRTALSRSDLFKTILELEPKKVIMFFDTCYSGVSRDEKTLLASARPIRITSNDEGMVPDNFTIFSASQLDQISSGLKEAKHGIFSYYLMKGLEGKADINQDKKITNGELLSYMNKNVSQKASELGRQQNPSFSGDPDQVLVSYR